MLSPLDWWNVIENYDKAIWPWQFVMMGVGLTLMVLFIVKPMERGRWIKTYLILINGWIAGGFFLNPARGFPSPIREFQGGLFIAVTLLWIFDLIRNQTELAWPESKGGRTAAILSLLVVLLYPVWGLLLGNDPSKLIYPGAFPCPTTAFSLILIIMAKKKRNPLLYLLLLIWAVPFPPTVQIPQYGVYEDGIMFLVGMAALFHLIGRFLTSTIRLKTDADHIARTGTLQIAKGILKGYITRSGFFLAGTVTALLRLQREYRGEYPKDFLMSAGLIALMYERLTNRLGKEKAFELVRAVVLPIGLATQQANFRNVESERTFENLISYQKRTNREGPTRLNTMEVLEESGERYKFKVTRCLFLEFFASRGVPELTKLMCAVDNAIFNSYLPEQVVFHREGKGNRMVDGSPHCLFVAEVQTS